MRPSKRVRKALDELFEIKEIVDYSCAGDMPRKILENFKHIEDTLVELAVDRKLNNIRFKKKLDMVSKIGKKSD